MMMKKFLALFLVLVMALSCVLVSCGKDGEDPNASTSDDGAWIAPSTQATTTAATTPEPVSTSKPSTEYTWTDDTASTTVYVRIDALYIRNDTLMDDKTIAGTAKFGDSFTRVKYNDQWTMISYNGKNCYVATAFITTDNGSVKFDDVAEKTMYINVEATLFLRTSTYTKNPDDTRYEDNIYSSVKRGVAVTQTGVSKNGNWARVKFEGRTLYCNTAYLSDTVPSDDTSVTPDPTPTPVG